MPKKRRAMTTEHARQVRLEGHKRESIFADLIQGEVNRGAQTDKKDVIDKQHRVHSVKGGQWWQVFLYGKQRFVSNTIFQNIGNIANLMIDCIDTFPEGRNDYEGNKNKYKTQLQFPMRKLAAEFNDETVKKAFFLKSLFNGGEVDYLTIQPESTNLFYIFSNTDVVDCLSKNIGIENSRARTAGQHDAQKVIFKIGGRNAGEIEIRTDSEIHYRQAKCRLNASKIFNLLKDNIKNCTKIKERVIVCGSASKKFKL